MTKSTLPTEPKTAPSVGFVSLGCPKNLVDSEVMMGLLDRAGARLTPRAEDAEILVVNTCSFIDSAKQESVNAILEMARHKTEGSAKRLIVAGCLVERYRDEIQKNIPEVDAVVGTGELEAILEAAGLNRPAPIQNDSPFNILSGSQLVDRASSAVNKHSRPEENIAYRPEGDLRESQGRFSRDHWQGAIATLPNYLYSDETPRILSTPRSSAYIKIAEGCDHPCGFCIIPQLRGKFRSRRMSSVIAEAENLVRQGVREITLIGQDTTCYGEDLGLKDGLADLLDAVAQIPGLTWLRFLYAYPNKVTTQPARDHRPPRQHRQLPRRPAAARQPRSLQAHEARRQRRDLPRMIERARSIVPNLVLRTHLHRRLPRRNRRRLPDPRRLRPRSQNRLARRLPLLRRRGLRRLRLDQKVPKRTIESRRKRLMKLQQTISAEPSASRGSAAKWTSSSKAPAKKRSPLARPHPAPRPRDRWQSSHQRLRTEADAPTKT